MDAGDGDPLPVRMSSVKGNAPTVGADGEGAGEAGGAELGVACDEAGSPVEVSVDCEGPNFSDPADESDR